MPKPKPISVHVNSTGKKKYKLLELIHSIEDYVFLAIEGSIKTELFNSGFLDGRKRAVRLEQSYDDCSGTLPADVPLSAQYRCVGNCVANPVASALAHAMHEQLVLGQNRRIS